MTFRERLEWIFRMALLLFILASVAFLSALLAVRFTIQGREVAVPDVVGKKAVEAQQILQGRGIGIRIEDHIFSSLPVDEVVRQSPPAGMKVKVGQYAHVALSLGPQKATIPLLEDRSLRAARIELLRSGMQIGEISSVYLPGASEETVLRQDPAPGKSDITSPHVNLLVSLGDRPAAYAMPELAGLSLAEAEARMSATGLRLGKLTFSPALGTTHGVVLTQPIPRGSRVAAGTPVDLQLSQ
ncbi:MAG: PASTA domain-containing protein [Candidatus Acidiferrales bacterium]